MYFDDEKHIEDVAKEERDVSQSDEDRNLDAESNPVHPSLLERIKAKFKRKKKPDQEK